MHRKHGLSSHDLCDPCVTSRLLTSTANGAVSVVATGQETERGLALPLCQGLRSGRGSVASSREPGCLPQARHCPTGDGDPVCPVAHSRAFRGPIPGASGHRSGHDRGGLIGDDGTAGYRGAGGQVGPLRAQARPPEKTGPGPGREPEGRGCHRGAGVKRKGRKSCPRPREAKEPPPRARRPLLLARRCCVPGGR